MSVKVNVYNEKLESVAELDLNSKVFGLEVNNDLVHQAMVAQMGNERQNLAHTKDRSEVRGGGKKPWRQKGTGRARAGSSRSPIWIGGGVTFGPTKDQNFSKKINVKMRRKATLMVLSDKVANESLVVLDKLSATEFKTSVMDKFLAKIEKKILKNERRSILVINDAKDDKLQYSVRNLAGTKVINLENINILDLLKYKAVLMSQEAVQGLEKRYK